MTSEQRAVMRVFASELDVVLDETAGHRNLETGGALFGLWTHGTSPTIFLATRPGHGAQHDPIWFGLDPQLYQDLEMIVWSRYGIQRLGLWHSHHGIGLHDLSSGDLHRAAEHAAKSHRFKLCDLLCYFIDAPGGSRRHPVIGVKPYVYRNAEAGDLLPTELEVLPGISPIREALTTDGNLSRAMASCLEAAPRDVGPAYEVEPFLPSSQHSRRPESRSAQPAEQGSERRGLRKLLSGLVGGPDEPVTGDDAEPGPPAAPRSEDVPLPERPADTRPLEDHVVADRPAPPALPPTPNADPVRLPTGDPDGGLKVIDDPGAFLNRFVAPTFGRLDQRGISYALNPSSDARTISCDLVRRDQGARVLLVLGWNGHDPVIAECVWSDGHSGFEPLPIVQPFDRHDIRRALRWAESMLVNSPRRNR